MSTRYLPSASQNKTLQNHDHLVSVGRHESGGVPDAYYLSLADQLLSRPIGDAGKKKVRQPVAPGPRDHPASRDGEGAR